MLLRYFGTDGIRGTYGEPPMQPDILRKLGYALARCFGAQRLGAKLKIVAARDTRISGPQILAAVTEDLLARGHRVLDMGVMPTPAVPAAIHEWGADLGLMITASHNPPEDNGVKIFDKNGLKLESNIEADIEAGMERERKWSSPPFAAPTEVGSIATEGFELYCHSRTSILPAQALAGWVVAVDAGYGATGRTTPEVFRRLGATVQARATEPDGARINVGCGSEHPEALAELVKQTGARLGVAHDGDGDRVVVCDETGAVVSGDEVLGLLALHALREGSLKHGVVVATVQSNLGLDQAVQAAGGRVVRVAVGDRNVLHKLLELGAALGGENSGHYIFTDKARCGDGLLAALMLARVMRDTGRPLSALRRDVPLLPQLTASLRIRVKRPFDELPLFGDTLQAAETALGGRGRVLARYSGTEKKLRLLVEGPERGELEKLLGTLTLAAQKDLGAE